MPAASYFQPKTMVSVHITPTQIEAKKSLRNGSEVGAENVPSTPLPPPKKKKEEEEERKNEEELLWLKWMSVEEYKYIDRVRLASGWIS